MSDKTCASCRFVHPVEPVGNQRQFCRRYPPATHSIIVPRQVSPLQPGSMQPVEENRSMFPAVAKDWGCGEFEARVELAS